jgi:hypothetical protein
MTNQELEKIKRFMNDPILSAAVKNSLQATFMRSRPEKEVYYLAAKTLALEFLEDAWRELEKHRQVAQKEEKKEGQIGL